MPQGGARGKNLGHLSLFVFCFNFSLMESFNLNNMYRLGFFSLTSDRKVQYPSGARGQNLPAGGIRASHGTFSSLKKGGSIFEENSHPRNKYM